MNFAFFGTPEFAAIILRKLIAAGFVPAAVVCNPDRPVGREKVVTFPPTKVIAGSHYIPVHQPETLTHYALPITNYDFAVVASYAKIIPQSILDLPRLGTIGVHPSLLPKYRGPSPIQSAILNDEKETGVTLYLMDEKVDHGKVISNAKCQISNEDIYETLMRKLAEFSGDLLIKTIPDFVAGKITPREQNHAEATYTKKFRTEDGHVDMQNDDPKTIWRKIRALNPEPGVWTLNYPGYKGKRVKLLETDFVPPRHSHPLRRNEGEASKNGNLILKRIQVEGKKPQLTD